MEFGSEFVYDYEAPDYEYISDEEYEVGMNVSGSDSDDEDLFDVADSSAVYESVSIEASEKLPLAEADTKSEPPVGVSEDGPSTPASPPPPGAPEHMCYENIDVVLPPPPPKARRGRAAKKVHHWRSAPTSHLGGNVADNAPVPPPPIPQRRGQRVRQGDTNIVSIKFNKLKAPSHMHAGDPQTCEGCGAILSKISKLVTESVEKVWECEFCSHRNVVDIDDAEIPQDEDVTFMLEPAPSTAASGSSGMDESLVVFCVDVSGSMCVTTEVPGHVDLRGNEGLRRARQMNRERGDQFLPGQRRDVTFVSRLQSVQAAIDHQLNEMQKEFPNRRVALVTFCNEVTVIGDGKKDPTSIAGDKLGKKDVLKSIASEYELPGAIKQTRHSLGEKLFQLEESGPTALGPALLVSTTIASRVRGSKVILCTDGLANVGMGKLDNFKKDGELEASVAFYEQVAAEAAQHGVSISVITIKGTDCKLVELGKMADTTGGQVNIVDPLKLTQEFSTILANKIIATNVVATVILHTGLYFLYEETEDSKVEKKIGNVSEDSEITFEYGVRTKENKPTNKGKEGKVGDPLPPVMEASQSMEVREANTDSGSKDAGAGAEGAEKKMPGELPFQLQIVYTDTEGAKALRLLTKTKPVTRDRRKAEKNCNLDVLGTHTVQQSAQLALDGQYTLSRQRALMNQRVAWRHTKESDSGERQNKAPYKNMFGKIQSMENYLNRRQQTERVTLGHTYSDDEDDEEVEVERGASRSTVTADCAPKSRSFLSRLRKKKQRSETTRDEDAALVFKGKSANRFFKDSSSDTP